MKKPGQVCRRVPLFQSSPENTVQIVVFCTVMYMRELFKCHLCVLFDELRSENFARPWECGRVVGKSLQVYQESLSSLINGLLESIVTMECQWHVIFAIYSDGL